jgi:hypothetical protein
MVDLLTVGAPSIRQALKTLDAFNVADADKDIK